MINLNESYENKINSFREASNHPTLEYYQNMMTLTMKEIQEHGGFCYHCKSKNTIAEINDGGSVYSCKDCGNRFSITKNNNEITVDKCPMTDTMKIAEEIMDNLKTFHDLSEDIEGSEFV